MWMKTILDDANGDPFGFETTSQGHKPRSTSKKNKKNSDSVTVVITVPVLTRPGIGNHGAYSAGQVVRT